MYNIFVEYYMKLHSLSGVSRLVPISLLPVAS